MSLKDLLRDMGKLETNLQRFETRFGVKSQDFYDAMLRGELEEFDALEDNQDEKTEALVSRLEEFVDAEGMKYSTLIEAV